MWVSLGFLDLSGSFLSHFREVFDTNHLKYFLVPFYFFSWDSYGLNVAPLNVIPEVSETVLISFYSLFFIPLYFSYFHFSSVIFQLTYLFFCLIYSTVGSLQCSLISVIYYSLLIVYFLIILGPCQTFLAFSQSRPSICLSMHPFYFEDFESS